MATPAEMEAALMKRRQQIIDNIECVGAWGGLVVALFGAAPCQRPPEPASVAACVAVC